MRKNPSHSVGLYRGLWLTVVTVAVMLTADLVLVPASERTAPWCLKGPLSLEHRNYSFSFLLTGHSFCRSSVTVALMKKYGSSLCPCPPHPLPLADNLPCQAPPHILGPLIQVPCHSKRSSTDILRIINSFWFIFTQSTQGWGGGSSFQMCFVLESLCIFWVEVKYNFSNQPIEERWKLWGKLVFSCCLSLSVAPSNQ